MLDLPHICDLFTCSHARPHLSLQCIYLSCFDLTMKILEPHAREVFKKHCLVEML